MAGRVLIVGAAGGVGSEVARLALASGREVVATVLNSREAEMLRSAAPGVATIIEMDCSDAEGVRRTLTESLARLGSLDAVVVCAAISPYGPIETESLALARRTLEINTVSGVAIYQATIPYLRTNRGRMVYISSMAGRIAMPFIGFYTASKFALEGAVASMRCEAARWGVEISLVEPGGIRTPMMKNQIDALPGDIERLDDRVRGLYGALYSQFHAIASKSYPGALDPRVVATVIMDALTAGRPKVRYKVGNDSKMLCLLAWLLPHRTFEALVLKSFASAGK